MIYFCQEDKKIVQWVTFWISCAASFILEAVQLESVSSVRVRYLIVVSTLGNKEESLLLGMDFPNSERFGCARSMTQKLKAEILWLIRLSFVPSTPPPCSDHCTIGLVMPIWSDTQVYLDGDGWDVLFKCEKQKVTRTLRERSFPDIRLQVNVNDRYKVRSCLMS